MLGFFRGSARNRRLPGLTGIDLQSEGVSVARVVREPGQPPSVALCDFRTWDSYDDKAQTLERIALDYDLARARCTTLLAESDYALLLTEAPDVPEDELRAAVRWGIKDLIDYHVNDATVDVLGLPTDKIAGRARAIYAVAARSDAIRRCVDLFDAADINLEIIDIAEMAQRNLAALLPEDSQGVAVLSLNDQDGLITVTKRGEIYLSRKLQIGLHVLTMTEDVSRELDQIVLEIQRSLNYYDSQFRQPPVAQLYLAPSARSAVGLMQHLNDNLDVGVSAIKLEAILNYDAQIPPALEAPCLMAIGAALRDERQVP